MSKQSDIIKNLVKKNVGEKPTFGTDPRDPWSTKYNVTEDAILNKYLLSKGINPKYVTKDQKVAHSKMGQFIKWKRDHAGMAEQTTEPSPTLARLKELSKSKKHQTPIVKGVAEAVDKKDTVTFDIPLLIRVLELAREDIKSDMDLHRVVERLINMRDKGMLTMDDYDEIAAIKEEVYGSVPLEYIKEALSQLKEEVEQVDEVRRGGFTAGWRDEKYFGKGVPTNRPMTDKEKADHEKNKQRQKEIDDILAGRKPTSEEIEQIDELKMSTVDSYFRKRRDDYHGSKVGGKKKGKEVSAKNVKTARSRLMGFKPTSEETYADAKAATPSVMSPGEGISEKMTTAKRIMALKKKMEQKKFDKLSDEEKKLEREDERLHNEIKDNRDKIEECNRRIKEAESNIELNRKQREQKTHLNKQREKGTFKQDKYLTKWRPQRRLINITRGISSSSSIFPKEGAISSP